MSSRHTSRSRPWAEHDATDAAVDMDRLISFHGAIYMPGVARWKHPGAAIPSWQPSSDAVKIWATTVGASMPLPAAAMNRALQHL